MSISLIFVCSNDWLIMFIPKDTYQNYENTPATWSTIGKFFLDSIVS